MSMVDDELLATLPSHPGARELRIAAAALWYERGLISQGRAARIAGVSRAELMVALARYGVSPFQETADEIIGSATHGR